MIRAPSSAWRCISAHSSSVRLAGFSRIESGIAELADVVEERRVAEQVELGLREAELAADRERELLHAARVAGRVGVARVDRRREALHRRRRALLQQPVRLLERDVLRVDRLGGLAQLLGAARVCERYASCVLRISSSGTAKTARA